MNDAYKGAERRKFQRIKVHFTVSYLIREPMDVSMRVGGEKVKTIMFDLSEEGMAIKSEFDMPNGATLLIIFFLLYASSGIGDIKQEMQIEGRVVNRTPLTDGAFRYGIHFEKIKLDDRKAIADFIDVFLNR